MDRDTREYFGAKIDTFDFTKLVAKNRSRVYTRNRDVHREFVNTAINMQTAIHAVNRDKSMSTKSKTSILESTRNRFLEVYKKTKGVRFKVDGHVLWVFSILDIFYIGRTRCVYRATDELPRFIESHPDELTDEVQSSLKNLGLDKKPETIFICL